MTSLKFKVVPCRIRLFPTLISKIKWLGSELPLSNLVDGLEDVADRLDRHVAAKDDDNDGFSDIGALRGYWWKGIDFEDEDNQVYPGRFPDDGDEYFDSNCNYLEGRIQDPGRSKPNRKIIHFPGFLSIYIQKIQVKRFLWKIFYAMTINQWGSPF